MVELVFNSTGLTPDNIRSTSGVDNDLDRIIRIFLALLVGQQDPLFPYLSSAFVGGIIGILYNQQQIPKKKCLYLAYSSCLLLVLIGVILLPFSSNIVDDIWNHIHAPWLLLINLGLQLACVFFLMSKIEFNPNNSKIVRRLRFFQRFGMVSLTIFCFELVDYIPRWIVTTLFHVDVMWGKTDNFLILLLLVALNLLLWAGIIRMWEVIRFYGTLESGMKIISSILLKNKINFNDPLNVREILYESEPVIFDKLNIKKT
jgi:hypothetical protein